MITLYHVPFTRSVRVRWLLGELGLPHDLVTLAHDELDSPRHARLLPLARVPVLEDGPVSICESGAIVQYLLDTYGYGRLEPARDAKDRAAYLQWFHFAEGALGAPLSAIAQHTDPRPGRLRIAEVAADAKRQAARALDLLDRTLQDRCWLTEQFSAADVMVGWSAAVADRQKLLDDDFPYVKRYVRRCLERPHFRRSMYS